jgi:hypothetical protein
MTAVNDAEKLARINAFFDEKGSAWGLIEQSGREGEHHSGALFLTYREALDYRDRHYDRDEIEDMPVSVARWDRQGEFWTYDF